MKTLILLAMLIIHPALSPDTLVIPDKIPHLVLRAQDLDGMVYGWCVDERGWHEFEAKKASDYIKAGFEACREG